MFVEEVYGIDCDLWGCACILYAQFNDVNVRVRLSRVLTVSNRMEVPRLCSRPTCKQAWYLVPNLARSSFVKIRFKKCFDFSLSQKIPREKLNILSQVKVDCVNH